MDGQIGKYNNSNNLGSIFTVRISNNKIRSVIDAMGQYRLTSNFMCFDINRERCVLFQNLTRLDIFERFNRSVMPSKVTAYTCTHTSFVCSGVLGPIYQEELQIGLKWEATQLPWEAPPPPTYSCIPKEIFTSMDIAE